MLASQVSELHALGGTVSKDAEGQQKALPKPDSGWVLRRPLYTSLLRHNPSSVTHWKAFKVHFKSLDCSLRPETRQRLLLVDEELHHCFHYLHNAVRSWFCADTLVEVYRHELRACENRLTFWLTTMITSVKEICCSIGQYASRRHLHSTGLWLSCSHIVHLDHRNFCTHTHANLPLTKYLCQWRHCITVQETQAQACYHVW